MIDTSFRSLALSVFLGAAVFVAVFAASVLPVRAQSSEDVPLPYFASLRFDRTYVRSGPGRSYPVLWVYASKTAPLEVVSVFDDWLRVRDWEGDTGWVLRSRLVSLRAAIVILDEVGMYARPDRTSRKIARLGKHSIAEIRKCTEKWCKIDKDSYNGWVRRAGIWGLYPDEIID